jgi:peptide/nickel transport system substrate-binding protein
MACKPPNYKNYLKIAILSDPQTFNPLLITDAISSRISSLMFDGLTQMDGETYQMKPSLATKWEHSKDGLTWTFHLRQNVRWSDGQIFTADDVLFTYQDLLYNPKIPVSSRDGLTINGKPIQWTKIDEYTVQAQLPKKFASFLRQLSLSILPKHVLDKNLKNNSFTRAWNMTANTKNIIGTGPFCLKNYRVGERLILERNPHYWKQDADGKAQPYLDGVIVFVLADQNTTLLHFERGELDILSMDGETYAYLSKRKGAFKIYELGPSWGTQFLTLHLQREVFPPEKQYLYDWFQKKSFRQALSYTIDRKRMIEQLFYDKGHAQYGPLSVANKIYYNDQIKTYQHNPKHALALLQESGFYLKDNFLYDASHRPVRFEVILGSESKISMNLGHMLQHDLKKIGIQLQLNPLPFLVMIQKVMQNQDWQAMLLGLSGEVDPYASKNVWTSEGHLHFWNLHSQKNFSWEERLDEIFMQVTVEMNMQKRIKLYNEWQELVAEELPLIYTVIPTSLVAVHTRLKNVVPSSFGGVLHHIEEIEIDGTLQ